MYYVCRVVEFPKLGGQNNPSELLLEIVDCRVPTLNPSIFNKAFGLRELAEAYIRKIGDTSVTYVVVYEPK